LMIRGILFDFDGVIVDSVDIKTQAFTHLFRHYPVEIRQQIASLHLTHSGLSRYDKFKIIYKEFFNQLITTAELEQLAAEFSRFCVDKIVSVPYVKGALEFVSNYHRSYSLFIVSSTPELELQAIVERRGIAAFFKGVYGTPRTKAEIIRMILKQKKLSPENAVFIGDAMSDFTAALECGTHFIGRIDDQSRDPLCQQPLRLKLRDLSNLNDMLLTVFNHEEVSP
jgi:beta-phosphoglucomutase-like phosphatase (HAD superfamily)